MQNDMQNSMEKIDFYHIVSHIFNVLHIKFYYQYYLLDKIINNIWQ